MPRRCTPAIGFVILLALLVSCSGVHEMAATLQDLQKVQRDLAKELGNNEIRVNLNNGRFLSIGVVNSPLRALPADQRNAKALELARIAYNSYPSRSALNSISVTFASHRSYLGVFTYDDYRDAFSFEASQLTSETQHLGESHP
jgi:hypothetical protein